MTPDNPIIKKINSKNKIFKPLLDKGIKKYVLILNEFGIETYESCQGGKGHPYPEPTIRFNGEYSEGFRALSIAMQYNFPIYALKRVWDIIGNEPVGPVWEIIHWK